MPTSMVLVWLSALSTLNLFPCANAQEHAGGFDPLQYVDQLIGSNSGGNIFPGATLPYGMAKAVADTNGQSNMGGFTLDGSHITGFSALHDSGTGGNPSLGNFPLFPYNGCPGNDVNACVYPKAARTNFFGSFSNSSIHAKPGYFGITLNSGPQVEMTTTEHTALFKFTFKGASDTDKPLILQDLSDLSDSRQDNGTVRVNPKTGRITGDAVFAPSFAQGTYRPYFCTDFQGAEIADSGIFVDSRASAEVHELKISRSINGYPLPGGAFVRFANGKKPVYARVGLSFISSAQACANAEREMPKFDFEKHEADAQNAWREKLSPITVDPKGVDAGLVKSFYSGIYRTMVNPQNYTGENPLWNDAELYFDSFYCIWDTFRTQFPFLTILDPKAVAQMVRSLISTYEHDGWLPDCRMSLSRGYTQGGSNADNVLADVYVKGIEGGIDWKKGYDAVKKDAEVEPYDWCCHGRGGIDSWKRLGYVPVQDFDYKGFGTMTRTISRTLEYAYNDFCIAQIAKGLGHKDEEEKYIRSSGNWHNLYKADKSSLWRDGSSTGFTGFFQPRHLNKTWGIQDPLRCSSGEGGCSLTNNGAETFESSVWEYGFFVPHDHARLIALYGGPESFVKRLNYLHDKKISSIGNEPSFLTVFQYHYAGRPAESARRSHFFVSQYFSPKPNGLPGNDDSGSMGSFLAFAMMGLFPNSGQNVYLITPPYFQSVKLKHPLTGKTATIRNINFDPTYKNIYIQSATLNGKPYTKNWIDHSFFTEGKELVLTLGSRESNWGTLVKDVPPSLSANTGLNGA
ncbi:hypothetical protein EsDP_00002823 [Epichloe bromicola]|uniref:Glycosyl hydrolase family 92 protein n=1 Tax=Epichloe bromicola TaxID=79588 RepID=A0ABQ0CMF8_9HYPO